MSHMTQFYQNYQEITKSTPMQTSDICKTGVRRRMQKSSVRPLATPLLKPNIKVLYKIYEKGVAYHFGRFFCLLYIVSNYTFYPFRGAFIFLGAKCPLCAIYYSLPLLGFNLLSIRAL